MGGEFGSNLLPKGKEQVANKTTPLKGKLPGLTDSYEPEMKALSSSDLGRNHKC